MRNPASGKYRRGTRARLASAALGLSALMPLVGGCVTPVESNGLFLGLGIFEVHRPRAPEGVRAASMRGLGWASDGGRWALGWVDWGAIVSDTDPAGHEMTLRANGRELQLYTGERADHEAESGRFIAGQ